MKKIYSSKMTFCGEIETGLAVESVCKYFAFVLMQIYCKFILLAALPEEYSMQNYC
jgi:hypothetical protein